MPSVRGQPGTLSLFIENVIVDRGGFIVARKATHASEGDWRPLIGMLEQLPIADDFCKENDHPPLEDKGGGRLAACYKA